MLVLQGDLVGRRVMPSGRSIVVSGPVNHFFADTCQPIHSSEQRAGHDEVV